MGKYYRGEQIPFADAELLEAIHPLLNLSKRLDLARALSLLIPLGALAAVVREYRRHRRASAGDEAGSA